MNSKTVIPQSRGTCLLVATISFRLHDLVRQQTDVFVACYTLCLCTKKPQHLLYTKRMKDDTPPFVKYDTEDAHCFRVYMLHVHANMQHLFVLFLALEVKCWFMKSDMLQPLLQDNAPSPG